MCIMNSATSTTHIKTENVTYWARIFISRCFCQFFSPTRRDNIGHWSSSGTWHCSHWTGTVTRSSTAAAFLCAIVACWKCWMSDAHNHHAMVKVKNVDWIQKKSSLKTSPCVLRMIKSNINSRKTLFNLRFNYEGKNCKLEPYRYYKCLE